MVDDNTFLTCMLPKYWYVLGWSAYIWLTVTVVMTKNVYNDGELRIDNFHDSVLRYVDADSLKR